MNCDDPMLAFVKRRLEEGEGIGSASLERLLGVARRRGGHSAWRRHAAGLLAASLAVATCGWFALDGLQEQRRAAGLADVLTLVRMADGHAEPDCESLTENLLAFQDAPLLDAAPMDGGEPDGH